jgi:hypothetical protein
MMETAGEGAFPPTVEGRICRCRFFGAYLLDMWVIMRSW